MKYRAKNLKLPVKKINCSAKNVIFMNCVSCSDSYKNSTTDLCSIYIWKVLLFESQMLFRIHILVDRTAMCSFNPGNSQQNYFLKCDYSRGGEAYVYTNNQFFVYVIFCQLYSLRYYMNESFKNVQLSPNYYQFTIIQIVVYCFINFCALCRKY